jgi:prepilin-type N-terminal cleavage/methylation domain-containing protein
MNSFIKIFRLRGPAFEHGFTLLEILVAVTLLALVFVSLFRLFGGTLRSVENSAKYAHAAVLAEQLLTELLLDEKAFPPAPASGAFGENPEFSYSLETSLYEREIGRTDVSMIEGTETLSTYQINLTVEWREGRGTRSLKLTTLKTVVEGEEP